MNLDEEIENWAPVKDYESKMRKSLDLSNNAQGSDRYVLNNRNYWKTYWEDAKSLVTAPAEFDGKAWLIAGTVIGAGVGMMILDDDIAGWVADNKNDTTQIISDSAGVVGNPFLMVSALFASYYYAKKTDNLRLTIFSMEYREKPWVAFVSYTLATAVGMHRIHDAQHWASDVFFGAAIGTAIGYLVYRNAERRPDWMFIPEVSHDYYGLRVTHDFGAGKNLQPALAE